MKERDFNFKIKQVGKIGIYKFPCVTEPGKYQYHFELEDFGDGFDKKKLRSYFEQGDASFFSVSDKSISDELELQDPKIINLKSILKRFRGFYGLQKWTFHENLVRHVIRGNYHEIMPISTEIVPTLNCCNRCPGCSYKREKECLGIWGKNDYHNNRVHMNDFSVMELIINQLSKAGVKSAIFTGGGEPTESGCTVPGIELAARKKLDVILYTNGEMLENDDIERIVKSKLFAVRISLNAGSLDIHAQFHGYPLNRNYFSRVIRNIESFASSRFEEGSPREFGIAFLVNHLNYQHLVETANLLASIADEKHKIDYAVYRPEINFSDPHEQLSQDIIEESRVTLDEEVRPILESSGIEFYGLKKLFTALSSPREYNSCLGNHLVAEITSDASMYICCPNIFHSEYYLGNLHEQSLREIMHGEAKAKILDKVREERLVNCPVICRSNETNKIFYKIEQARGTKNWERVVPWIHEQKKLPIPRGVNFVW